jgi:hypothetical protein
MYTKNKIIVMSLIASTQLGLFGGVIPQEKGTVSGLVRFGYVDQDNAVDTDRYTTAIGAILKYETPVWNGLKLGIAGYGSQKLPFATGSRFEDKSDKDFLGEEANSFAYVGEAYADYNANDLNIRIGRQLIETPLINMDDIRMLPDGYEAALATYSGIDKTTLTAGYIKRWAGYDSGADISKFKKVAEDSHGASMFGIRNEGIDDLVVQGWFYSIDKKADTLYTDASYNLKVTDESGFTFMGQYANVKEDMKTDGTLSGTDGHIYGLAVNGQWKMLTVGAAYNVVSNPEGKSLDLGLGGGAYYTSMEEWTIMGMEDAKARQYKAVIDMTDAGINGLSVTTLYGEFKSAPTDTKMTEWDVIATYSYSDALSADISYATLEDKNKNIGSSSTDGGYDRFLARLHYRF